MQYDDTRIRDLMSQIGPPPREPRADEVHGFMREQIERFQGSLSEQEDFVLLVTAPSGVMKVGAIGFHGPLIVFVERTGSSTPGRFLVSREGVAFQMLAVRKEPTEQRRAPQRIGFL